MRSKREAPARKRRRNAASVPSRPQHPLPRTTTRTSMPNSVIPAAFDRRSFLRVSGAGAGRGSTTAEEIVVSGKALVGLSAPIGTVPSVLKGAPLKIIGSTYQKNPFCLMSLEDGTPIRTVADLKGKKLGVQAGANQTIIK